MELAFRYQLSAVIPGESGEPNNFRHCGVRDPAFAGMTSQGVHQNDSI
jgi:hypothetical protein